ncbi:YbaY family lipoprotein [Vibrio ziniensis]|uniref:Lipo-like protein n=1 Tax=Vibrio ziniensis TaxID=2711221 RepID=A0A6G7CJC0_9VIBR|nr:YbaY family lipoprotein [Vibrio ziniensis]QIH42241.1 lipo-like protein [Vibrio ziniensis]
MKKIMLLVASLVAGSLFMVGCQSSEEPMSQSQSASQPQEMMKTVTGTITYRERIALPDNAQVMVLLQDVSRMDTAAIVITKQQFMTNGHQVPLAFELAYDESVIQPKHTYAVSARIEVGGKLRFITDTQYLVITDEKNTTHADVRLIGVPQQ